jgi:rsbT co-antagonist protein RsbR
MQDKTNEQLIAELTEARQYITELEQMVAKSQTEHSFAESLIETAQTIILVLDPIGRIVRFNPYMEEVSGYSLSEVQGKDWFSVFLPEQNSEQIRTLFLQAIDDIHTQGNVNTIIAKDGSERLIEWYDKTIKDENGDTIGLLAVGQDITKHQQMELQFEQQKDFLENILESISHPLYVINAQDYTVKLANSAARELGDLSKTPTCYAFTHKVNEPCNSAEHPCPLLEVQKTKSRATVEHIHYDAQGQPRNVEVHGYPILDEASNVVQMVEYSLDVTERKQAETEREELRQQQIEMQQRVIEELSIPIIPVVEGVIVIPLIGSIDSLRAGDIMRTMLAGVSKHQAKIVIMDITGVPIVDTGVAAHLDKTIQAARLKGARTIVTGISDAVAETIVDLGIDWSRIETLRDLQTGLIVALNSLGLGKNMETWGKRLIANP